jgi:hypothetical protein
VLAIETHGLAKTYAGPFARAGHDALKGVDLSVEQGSAFGLIGPNGAGKRLAAVASRVEIHADAMRDVAVVARVTGPDAAQIEDLGKSIGTALALARLGAKVEGSAVLADILEFATVKPGRGAFSVEMALPVEVLERWFAGCGEGPREAGAPR